MIKNNTIFPTQLTFCQNVFLFQIEVSSFIINSQIQFHYSQKMVLLLAVIKNQVKSIQKDKARFIRKE